MRIRKCCGSSKLTKSDNSRMRQYLQMISHIPIGRFFFSGCQIKAIFPTESVAQDTIRSNGHKLGDRVKAVSRNTGEQRVCFYCLDPGHFIYDCQAWINKKNTEKPKHVAFIQSAPDLCATDTSSYGPFLRPGFVSLTGSPNVECVQILRDTGSAQSFILEDVLPFSDVSYTGANVLVCGIEMVCVSVPLHVVNIKSDLATGVFQLGVCKKLPVDISALSWEMILRVVMFFPGQFL